MRSAKTTAQSKLDTPRPPADNLLTADEAVDLFRREPHRFLDIGHGEVAYRRVGSGPDVLFVHGFPVSGATFRSLLPYLAPHLTCHVIDLVGAGQSRFDTSCRISLAHHIEAVQKTVDLLGLSSFGVVGHDSGGLIARHALAGDKRLRCMALIDTEQPEGLSARFRQFLLMAKLPGFAGLLGWAANQRRLRRSRYLLGDCFAQKALLDGTFDEFFLRPLWEDKNRRWAAGQLVRSFDVGYVDALVDVHARIEAPVILVWGERDPFFPVAWAEAMVDTFPDARLHVVPDMKLFVHEEKPDEVAAAILPTLLGTR